jgi:hypothetical protein
MSPEFVQIVFLVGFRFEDFLEHLQPARERSDTASYHETWRHANLIRSTSNAIHSRKSLGDRAGAEKQSAQSRDLAFRHRVLEDVFTK